MAYNIKGFVEIDGIRDTSPDGVAVIGECSAQSRTFSTSVGEYTPANSDYRLLTFRSRASSGEIAVPDSLVTQILKFADTIYKRQLTAAASTDEVSLANYLKTQFPNALDVNCGPFVSSGAYRFPAWYSFNDPTVQTTDPTTGAVVKIWLSNAAFADQYDEVDLKIVPPLRPIDDFHTGATNVASRIKSSDVDYSEINRVAGGKPFSELRAQRYYYVDPTNPKNEILTTWTILVYGGKGITLEKIQKAVQDYIAANSGIDKSKWQVIFPSIYRTTEFYMIPRWQNVAIPEAVDSVGTYSPVINLNKERTYIKSRFGTLFTEAHVDAHLTALATTYNSLTVLAISSEQNSEGTKDLSNMYDDYISVPTSDPAFGMMSAATRGWVQAMQRLYKAAESYTNAANLPSDVTVSVRQNVVYLASQFDGVSFLVAAKNYTPGY